MPRTDAQEGGRSQTDVVIDSIKGMLTRGELVPGSRLPIEKDLAERLGVSRGPLREGVRALVLLGVLETKQGDGTFVTSLDPRTLLSPLGFFTELQQPAYIVELLAVRRVLEAESVAAAAIRLTEAELIDLDRVLSVVDDLIANEPDINIEACVEADAEFHRIIARGSGNRPLAAIIDTLGGRTFRARVWRAISSRGAIQETQSEHRAILDALVRRDPERARIRMSSHLLGVEEFSAEHADEDPDRIRLDA